MKALLPCPLVSTVVLEKLGTILSVDNMFCLASFCLPL